MGAAIGGRAILAPACQVGARLVGPGHPYNDADYLLNIDGLPSVDGARRKSVRVRQTRLTLLP